MSIQQTPREKASIVRRQNLGMSVNQVKVHLESGLNDIQNSMIFASDSQVQKLEEYYNAISNVLKEMEAEFRNEIRLGQEKPGYID